MKIALVGAGHIGQRIATLLSQSEDFEVTVIDSNESALAQVEGLPNVGTAHIDAFDSGERMLVMAEHEVVVNALPHHMNETILNEVEIAGTHYFDLSEDVATTNNIMNRANRSNSAYMPQCGLAPGFVGIVANHLCKGFDELHDVKMRVGALPQSPTNALKYNLTWSVDGLINEYSNPCNAIINGSHASVLPLEGLERFTMDGIEYEAFNTSGGLGSMCSTMKGKVHNLDYKTVRYPGHRDIMKLLLDDLKLKDDRTNLRNILTNSIPSTTQDMVLVFVSVTGLKNGKLVQEVFSRKVFSEPEVATAIQITTASGICVALDLFRRGKLPQRGFIKQEDIGLPAFLNNRFGSVYK